MSNKNLKAVGICRETFSQTGSISAALHEVIAVFPEFSSGGIKLVVLVCEAFDLPLRDAAPVGGWQREHPGSLNDEGLDRLLGPVISSRKI